MLGELTTVFITLALAIVAYFKWNYRYWERKGVPFETPRIPFGNSENPFKRKTAFGTLIKAYYDRFKSQGHRHAGLYLFTRKTYLPIDPEIIKIVLAKDFGHFINRGVYYNEKDDPISAHLISLEGSKWRNLRAKLTPTFTSGKMKTMFPNFVECGRKLAEDVASKSERNEPIDIKETSSCYTLDVIGNCAFGLECKSFEDPDSPFRAHGKRVFTRTSLSALKFIFSISFPNLSRGLGIRAVPANVSEFFINTIKDTVEYRESTNAKRNDFLQMLIDMKNDDDGAGQNLTIEQISAQSFLFFLAGYETSSTVMTFCLYELAINPDIQRRAREEILMVLERHGGRVTYEAVADMKYLGQVIDETMRKYPPVPYIVRKCVEDYQLPGEDLMIEKGITVGISVIGLHYDPEYFPEPEKFDPDRFSDENKHSIKSFTYMPFGEGPRNCIGLRFGVMQTKVGLMMLLRNFHFSLNSKTKTPLEWSPRSFVLTSKDVIWLDATKIEN